ncbi:hypothetical protein AZE42_03559 [Rhizopogon vesiculosus]|uniref:CDP-diacylglycerol--glycerol-3-phosphate 3-phosphatidyltransferase n=1 Tax=Rhizopogon vesiculosus TaxID=180088 RepID=A0A1J8R5I4_9AGAM|nr:hypothetical protein AZE42_03559 [Rhizopogon vesiculosus]
MLAAAYRHVCRHSNTHRALLKCFTVSGCARSLSSTRFDPTIREFVSRLAQKQPSFPVASKDVHVLSQPSEFYQNLLNIIRRARRRIFLSSLYIGFSETELVDALDDALRRNPDLHLYLNLDYNRSTRPGPTSPILALLPLLRNHEHRVHISLFRSPRLNGMTAKIIPPRFNEGWGTWHAKIYGSDDDVMISGANLNKAYFSNRQDRYLHFSAQPALADYCFSFLQTVSGFSYRVLANFATDEPVLHWEDTTTLPWQIQSKAERALSQFQMKHLLSSVSQPSSEEQANASDVLIFPVIQAGQFDVREEEHTLTMLFDHLASREHRIDQQPVMNLTSGYFGLSKQYQDLILKSNVACSITAASPKANGFYGSGGLSGLIPEGYTLLEQRFMRAVKAASRSSPSNVAGGHSVSLREWERDGWTYHAKGIWFSPSVDTPPVLTLFGSTNLNSRSANLDTELSFVMVTSSDSLRQKLQEEIQALHRWAVPWRGGERKVRCRTKAIVGLVGGML